MIKRPTTIEDAWQVVIDWIRDERGDEGREAALGVLVYIVNEMTEPPTDPIALGLYRCIKELA